jgi:hypothetical protein
VSVRFRMVKTALETRCRMPGGKRIAAALGDASKNLESLAPESLRLIDSGLKEISALVDAAEQARPGDDDLVRVRALADELVGYCATVDLPGLDTAFIRLCQLTEAVLRTTYWKSGTFAPTLLVLKMARHRALTPGELEKLFKGIDQCTEKYLSSRPAGPSGVGQPAHMPSVHGRVH